MRESFKDAIDADRAGEQNIWDLIIGPSAWAAHFMASYGTAALFCAKFAADFTPARYAIAGYTAIALVVIALSGLRALRTWNKQGEDNEGLSHPGLQGRRRFVGFAGLLLCTVSFIATVYTAMPAAVFSECR